MQPRGLQTAVLDNKTPISLTDYRLVQQALNDPRAVEHILRRVYPKIFQIARFAVRRRKEADDIAQLAALEVLKSLPSFKGSGTLEAWAGQITYRVAIRSLKKDRRTAAMFFPLTDTDIPTHDTPEKSVSRRRLFEKLLSEMEIIPKKRRIPLLLHLVYGYTVNEVAEVTNASPNTVKDRLKTAYREMRLILKEHPHLRAAMLEAIP